MFCPVNIPIKGKIENASPNSPFVVASMKLDLQTIKDILIHYPEQFNHAHLETEFNFQPWQLEQPLEQAFERLLLLHETPKDIDFLAPLIQREIYYRLLRGDQGQKLKHMIDLGSNTQKIAKATNYIQEHFNETIAIQALATLCHMSISGFHQHFKKLTSLSPLQYQKSLRLATAKKLIKQGDQTISDIAYQVGYESPSQFSREYHRYFGNTPSSELRSQISSFPTGHIQT